MRSGTLYHVLDETGPVLAMEAYGSSRRRRIFGLPPARFVAAQPVSRSNIRINVVSGTPCKPQNQRHASQIYVSSAVLDLMTCEDTQQTRSEVRIPPPAYAMASCDGPLPFDQTGSRIHSKADRGELAGT